VKGTTHVVQALYVPWTKMNHVVFKFGEYVENTDSFLLTFVSQSSVQLVTCSNATAVESTQW